MCSQTPEIELLQSKESFGIKEAMFRWQGTIICLAQMWSNEGERYLSVTQGGAAYVEPITVGNTATWITSSEDVQKNAVVASIISGGSARNVTQRVMSALSGRRKAKP